ncbi:MAG: hypothetical protein HOO92_06135 [Methylococcaceae bacterium]|nr:hypothetical protein [Methylococcaceae bacterium]
MKRNCQLEATCLVDQDLIKQIAFHEAGHATAIYLYNKQKQLPPVFFQITIKAVDRLIDSVLNTSQQHHQHVSGAIEGGHLIQSLPVTFINNADYFSVSEQAAHRTAFEADMINLMVGPLAEAKHVAMRDNEHFNAQLVNIHALHNYGGSSDLAKIDDYLDAFIGLKSQYEKKLAELFDIAFNFISSPVYWKAIERLADYIYNHRETTISCEEAIAVLDKSINEESTNGQRWN